MFAEVTGAPPQRLANAPVLAVQAPGRRLTGFPDAVARLFEAPGRLHQLILDRGERLGLGRGHPGCLPAIHLGYMAENSLGVRSCLVRHVVIDEEQVRERSASDGQRELSVVL